MFLKRKKIITLLEISSILCPSCISVRVNCISASIATGSVRCSLAGSTWYSRSSVALVEIRHRLCPTCSSIRINYIIASIATSGITERCSI